MDDRKAAILREIPRLRRYARGLMRDRDDADDLVQDCLERALSRLSNWQTGETPRRWLFTLMHNIFIDTLRRRSRRSEALHVSLEAPEAMAVPGTDGEGDATVPIMEALQALSPERRSALLMVAVEGFSYAEAATILGVPAGTLMSRVSRGREDLRSLLETGGRRRALRVVDR